MTYQYNILPEQNVRDGHEVLFIAAARTYKKSIIVPVEPEDKVLKSGVRLIRLPNKKLLLAGVARRFNVLEGLEDAIKSFQPDVIWFHSINSLGLLTAANYNKANTNVKLYVDSHADDNNSAHNFLSRFFLHRLIWRNILKRIDHYVEKFMCINIECADFLMKYYGVSKSRIEIYPLGGLLPSDNQYLKFREITRAELKLDKDDILLVHSGKIDALKKPRTYY